MNIKQSKRQVQIECKKVHLFSGKDAKLVEVVFSEANQQLIKSAGVIRERLYTPLRTLYTFVKQILSPDKSCKNAVARFIAERLLEDKSPICPNTDSYTKARNRLPETTIYELVKSVGRLSLGQTRASWKPYGRELKAFDGTIITLADTKANQEIYPKHSNKHKAVGFPQVRLLAIMSLSTGSVVDYALEASKGKGTGETTLLRSLLDSINENDIVVGDRLYCNFF
jgi:hypothetical protein